MGRRFASGSTGATAIEYALIAALIAVSSLMAWALLGQNVSSTMSSANAQLSDGITPTQDTGAAGKD